MQGTLNSVVLPLKLGNSLHSLWLAVSPYELLQEKKRVMGRGKANIYAQTDAQSALPGSANTGRNTEFLFCSLAEITGTFLIKNLSVSHSVIAKVPN